ncbi:MAG: DUF2292 domain-containing protein [Firmicutes bacterium]|nr:DUF2292 domain-containing protein [Bacillota bacterium]
MDKKEQKIQRIELSKQETIRRILKALDEITNGEITIKVQGGKPIWVDKFERERVG